MAVTTGGYNILTSNSVEVSGEIIDLGEGAIRHGFLYSTTKNFAIKGSLSTNLGKPNKTGSFANTLQNLESGVAYYYKAYLSNTNDTVYGLEEDLPPLCISPSPPIVGAIIQPTCAVPTGSVVLSGLPSSGTWTLTRMPDGTTLTGTETSITMTGLPAGTTYTFTVTDSSGCVSAASGNVTINAQPESPSADAGTGGNNCGNEFTLGATSSGGVGTWTIDSGPGAVTFIPNANDPSARIRVTIYGTYVIRWTVVNGTCSNSDIITVVFIQQPLATTNSETYLTNTTVTLNGTVNPNGSSTIVSFEYGTTASYGLTKLANQSPVSGTTTANINTDITGLTSGQIYHYRIKAENVCGTSFGSDETFVTTIKDIEGNVYDTVRIGSQVWMIENLKTTKYNNGVLIPLITDNTEWSNLDTPGYCWYNNEISFKNSYGALYNWYTVNTGILCPDGWHVPTNEEWYILTDYLGGESVAGDKLKEAGTAHWATGNTGTNSSGFTALPGGGRQYEDGTFGWNSYWGYWWSSTVHSTNYAWGRELSYNLTYIKSGGGYYKFGFSVRCLRD